jgi:hypothetical protein
MLWAEWLDVDDNLGQRKEVTPFHGFESMQPCSLLYRVIESGTRTPNRNPREVFMSGFAWNILTQASRHT